MQKICDLHIHSKYSRGASKNINIFKIALNSEKKGLDIIGTGDCLHPSWLYNLKNSLIEYSDGVYYLPKRPNVYFILQTEVELIWKYNSHLKKIHFLILFPNFEKVEESAEFLSKFSNLMEEGRPKIYNSAEYLIYGLKTIDFGIEIIPAHIFTPFFGIYGEKSRFKNMKEALGEGFSLIHAVETGLSADPFMIRCISELNRFTITSNSDCHSTLFHRLGRESSLYYFNKLDYRNIIESIRKNKVIKTYEFKPSAGKYYYDGHRKERHENNLAYFCSPKLNLVNCPHCNKKLTKGVLSRVLKLGDQKSPKEINFQYIVPLLSLISVVLGGTEYDKKNLSVYNMLISNNGSEYNIWEGKSNFEGLSEDLISAINKIRTGDFWFIPGYDANYGKLKFNA
ncbi:MAG: endonuclease Q family protein [Candidatus Thorarchaeota archaeon]